MTKIGRNDQCPCLSGKKYKRCCLDLPVISDEFTATLFERIEALSDQIKRSFKDARLQISDSAEAMIQPGDPQRVCEQIIEYLHWLEAQVDLVARRHSAIFWLCLDRRFPPGFDEGGDELRRQLMSQMVNTAKTLQFHKYGNASVEPMTLLHDGSFSFEVTDDDIVAVFGYLKAYLHELAFLPNEYRRAGKGAIPHTERKSGLITQMPEHTEQLVQFYDKRRMEGNGGFLSTGGLGSFPVRALTINDDSLLSSISTIAAVATPGDHSHVVDGMGQVKSPGFDLTELDLGGLEQLRPFETRFLEVTGLTLDQLRDCYVAFKRYLLSVWLPIAEYTLVTRGIWFADEKTLRQRLVESYATTDSGSARDPLEVEEVIEKFLKLLEGNPRSCDLLLRQNQCSLSRTPTICALDLSISYASLFDVITDLGIDAEMKRMNGTRFEEYVTQNLMERVPSVRSPIPPGLALKRTGEKEPFAQLDTYAQVEDILFLVESKAYSVTREYLKGEPQAVWSRWILVQEWLSKSDSRAQKIVSAHTGSNFSLPSDVKFVVPIICTAFNEFVWSTDEQFYLRDAEIPRICTPNELIAAMTGPLGPLRSRSFTIRV